MSTPEDSKIDFEKLILSEDLSGSLEPIAEDATEQVSSEQEAEAKTQEGEEEGKLPEAEEEGELPEAEEEVELSEAEPESGEAEPAAEPSKFKGLLERLSTADPFTVLLGLTVAVLLIAILCCLIELGRYHFDTGAKGAKQTTSIMVTADFIKNLS